MNTASIAFALARAAGEAMDEFESGEPDEVFHYTDAGGLIGILAAKGELWATDVRCMNDANEMTHGNVLLQKAIEERRGDPACTLLSGLLEHPAFLSGIVFTTSFSSERDLLSQWRAYADNGAGFALGFRSAGLKELTLDGNRVVQSLVRVEYGADVQRLRAQRLVNGILEKLEPLGQRTLDAQDEQMLATALGLVLTAASAASKNSGFEEEAEHRIVLRSHQDPLLALDASPSLTMPVCQFRSGKYGITPFLKLRFPDGMLTRALSRIVMGPRVAAPDSEQKVRALLANAGVQNWSTFPIERAMTSYR
ncbi:DUF2971 domain-containing protein [Variovorax ureilyticus]|uniref:DUF2971 domain-containing protein n=1 Tax=Variovorax ureilyticus TaxID=1836198 RepID=UPI003D664857